MALNNLLNLPASKVALKPSLPPLPSRPSFSAPPRRSSPRPSLIFRSEPPGPQRVRSSASSPPPGAAAPSPPSSREDAVAQARSCLALALQKPLNNSVPLKKLKRQRQPRFRAEIPVVDDSPGSLARLALDVFSGGAGVVSRRKGAPARLLLVWPSAEALSLALREFEKSGDSTTAHAQLGSEAPLVSACDAAVFVAPAPAQVEKVKAAAAAAEPKPVVLFNPAWSFDEEEEGEAAFGGGGGARGFVASFEVVYSFTGLEVRGLLSKKRGVLLRCVDGGRLSGESWVLMVENDGGEGQEFKVVSRLKKRPTIGEVETMLYNLMAANSPVTKSARFLREMVSNVTRGKAKQ